MKQNIYTIGLKQRVTSPVVFLLTVVCLLMSSCGDFLEEESQSEVIPKTTEDFSEFLIGNAYPDNYNPDFSFISMLDDDCAPDFQSSYWDNNAGGYINSFINSMETLQYAAYYQWQPYMCDENGYGDKVEAVENAYKGFYKKIMGCNAVLDNIDDALGNQENKDRVKAEALAIRSLMYFQLVNLFGEPYNYNKEALGVPLKTNANLSDEGIARATVREVYEDLIVPGLVEAARLMDPLEYVKSNYRINQPAIHIILSRVYLFMDKYDECIAEVKKALKQSSLSDMSQIDPYSLPYGYNPYDYGNPEVLWMFGPGTRVESSSYRCGRFATDLIMLFDQMNDIRYNLFGFPTDDWGVFKKVYGNSALCQTIRVAEAYLNKAEAEALSGKGGDALNDLNTFCKSRIKGYTDRNLSGNELLQTIRNERRKEFCYEGYRWFDLRRYGMPAITHEFLYDEGGQHYVFTLNEKDPMYTLPLPNALFENNRSLQQSENRNMSERQSVVKNN